ncbi:hypothetical protein SKAU_G00306270 [Synaphobranchus kaupii]|uniref:Uncharacterized protein n=1 Tax=Synaphobranchus kaupii TaxID=118154 RepID=A0A9Q1EQT1_SYNKA|nr:hypothetical protein SKAU_G00306270 [Synaphobranchus kaupii]
MSKSRMKTEDREGSPVVDTFEPRQDPHSPPSQRGLNEAHRELRRSLDSRNNGQVQRGRFQREPQDMRTPRLGRRRAPLGTRASARSSL